MCGSPKTELTGNRLNGIYIPIKQKAIVVVAYVELLLKFPIRIGANGYYLVFGAMANINDLHHAFLAYHFC